MLFPSQHEDFVICGCGWALTAVEKLEYNSAAIIVVDHMLYKQKAHVKSLASLHMQDNS